MTASEQPDQWVWLARILRPQGRKGEVFADILTDFPEKFADRRRLWLLPADDSARTAGAPRSAQKLGAPGPDSGTWDAMNPSLPARKAELTHHWLHKGGIVLHFSGVDSITAAEALKGLIVAIPLAERAALTEDEAYIADLVGCTLVDVAGNAPVEVGLIDDVDRTAGPVPLFIVHSPKGEILIPFAKLYLRKIDLTAKRVEMALPEGLVDLNISK
jgi:16S rRNA processing protein RimM